MKRNQFTEEQIIAVLEDETANPWHEVENPLPARERAFPVQLPPFPAHLKFFPVFLCREFSFLTMYFQ